MSCAPNFLKKMEAYRNRMHLKLRCWSFIAVSGQPIFTFICQWGIYSKRELRLQKFIFSSTVEAANYLHQAFQSWKQCLNSLTRKDKSAFGTMYWCPVGAYSHQSKKAMAYPPAGGDRANQRWVSLNSICCSADSQTLYPSGDRCNPSVVKSERKLPSTSVNQWWIFR